MQRISALTSRITSKWRFVVKLAIALSCISAYGEAPSSETPDKIQARRFKVSVVRPSRSQKVYLFQDLDEAKPVIGKIFLLKKNGSAVMAFRTLKVYGEEKQIAARRLKSYGPESLDAEAEFTAIEKTGDVTNSALTHEDVAELTELDGNAADAQTPPAEDPKVPSEEDNLPESLEDFPDEESLIVDEINPLDPEMNWLSVNLGILKNNNAAINPSTGLAESSGSLNLTGPGLRYGYTVAQRPFLNKSTVQDSITLELGFYYYRLVNYLSTSDTYTVAPALLTARYNLFVSDSFGVFGYLGFMKNFVLSSTDSTPETLAILGGVLPAAGLGVLFRIGPSWMLRAEFGAEALSAGLVLRY